MLMTYQVEILNPQAAKLLQDMAEMQLIAIRETATDGFEQVVARLHAKAASSPPSLADITREVKLVGAKRYGKGRG